MKAVMRTYSCWYYCFALGIFPILIFIVYFMIVFKPFNFLYKLSGIMMTFCLLVGYAICFMDLAFITQSNCDGTIYGKVGEANTIIFLVIGSFTIIFAHILALLSSL